MPRKHNQGPEGYEIAIAKLEGEYARAAANTSRSPAVYKGYLERIEWCLSRLRLEHREIVTKKRAAVKKNGSHVARSVGPSNGAARKNGSSAAA